MTEPAQKTPSIFKVLIPVFVIILAAIGGLTLLKKTQNPAEKTDGHIAVGSVIPELDLVEYPKNNTIKLSSLKHKVTLLNFWASWCEACMVEIPSILKLRESYQDRGFGVVFLNVDQNPQAVLPKILADLKINFPIYTDTEGTISEIFDVHAIPLTVIFDQNQKILWIESGEKDWNSKEIRKKVEEWLR